MRVTLISITLTVRFERKNIYSLLGSVSCPKILFYLESDNLFRITIVVTDWQG